jgi:hypothetical protein
MRDRQDPANMDEMAIRLGRLEELALASNASAPPWRGATLQHPGAPDGWIQAEGPAIQRSRSNHQGISPWLFVMATALNTMVAAVLAVIITLGVVRQEQAGSGPRDISLAAAASARASTGLADDLPNLMTSSRAVDVRPIGSPEQPLRAEPRKPVRLPLQLQPEDAGLDTFILVLSGVPAGTTLSGASRIGSDTWLLPPNSANRLEITIPEWSMSVYEVAMELRRTNGMVAAQSKAWIAVPPPNAQLPAGTRVDEAAARDLVSRGDQLLDRGDVVGARGAYQRAAEMGNSAGALALGSTYDPNLLWSLGALGMVGNKERARQWYSRADQLGHPDAKNRLRVLGN